MKIANAIEKKRLEGLLDPNYGGGLSLVKEIVEIFISQMPDRLAGMEISTLEFNLTEVARLAHNVKTGALYVGAEKFAQVAERLEYASERGDTMAVNESIGELKSLFGRVEGELRQLLDEMQSR